MDTRNIRSFALLSFFFAVLSPVSSTTKKPPVPVDNSKAPIKETFTITVNIYSGRENPSWIVEGDQILPKNIIKRMLRLDNHGPDHGAHGAHGGHGGHGKKKKLANVSGYQGITIEHKKTSGYTHTMILPRCDDPFLEWDIVARSFPRGQSGKGTALSSSSLATLKKLLQECVLKERAEKAAAAAAAKNAGSGSATAETKPAHDHAGHAH